jgi:hypothetical protein
MQRRMHGPIHGPLRSNKTGFSMIGHGKKSRQVVEKIGGASRDRTDDLIVANDALSQLSYSPMSGWIAYNGLIDCPTILTAFQNRHQPAAPAFSTEIRPARNCPSENSLDEISRLASN